MAGIQRMIKSGFHVYNRNPIINRVGASAASNRSLYIRCGPVSNSEWEVKNVKNTFTIDTSAMTSYLKEGGIPPHKAEAITKSIAEYLVELETVTKAGGDASIELKDKFKSLEKSMRSDKIKENPEVKKWRYVTEAGFKIAVIAGLTCYFTSK